MKHLKRATSSRPMEAKAGWDPCIGLTGLELTKCRKQHPEPY